MWEWGSVKCFEVVAGSAQATTANTPYPCLGDDTEQCLFQDFVQDGKTPNTKIKGGATPYYR